VSCHNKWQNCTMCEQLVHFCSHVHVSFHNNWQKCTMCEQLAHCWPHVHESFHNKWQKCTCVNNLPTFVHTCTMCEQLVHFVTTCSQIETKVHNVWTTCPLLSTRAWLYESCGSAPDLIRLSQSASCGKTNNFHLLRMTIQITSLTRAWVCGRRKLREICFDVIC